jgi:hypothetical protein
VRVFEGKTLTLRPMSTLRYNFLVGCVCFLDSIASNHGVILVGGINSSSGVVHGKETLDVEAQQHSSIREIGGEKVHNPHDGKSLQKSHVYSCRLISSL